MSCPEEQIRYKQAKTSIYLLNLAVCTELLAEESEEVVRRATDGTAHILDVDQHRLDHLRRALNLHLRTERDQ